jgi:hypothetical protein
MITVIHWFTTSRDSVVTQMSFAIKMAMIQKECTSAAGNNVANNIWCHSYDLYLKIVVIKYAEQINNCETENSISWGKYPKVEATKIWAHASCTWIFSFCTCESLNWMGHRNLSTAQGHTCKWCGGTGFLCIEELCKMIPSRLHSHLWVSSETGSLQCHNLANISWITMRCNLLSIKIH